MQQQKTFKRQINNRKEAHITKIEFAPIEEGHLIVRLTCQTSRPTTTAVSTYLMRDTKPGGTPEIRGIKNAISALREEYSGTKLVLDPDAELQPLALLAKWEHAWQEPLHRASLGLNWSKDFPMTSDDIDHLNGLDDEDVEWVLENARQLPKGKSNGTSKQGTAADANMI